MGPLKTKAKQHRKKNGLSQKITQYLVLKKLFGRDFNK